MSYKKHLLHILLCLQIFTVSLHASYPLKFVFLLTNIGKKALKASALCIPTFMGLSKINKQINKQKIDYLETLIFVYPFDKEQQQKLLPLKNEIKDLALKTMPDAYSSCKTPKALVEYVESKKTEKLKKLFGEQFKFDEIALEQNMQKSKEAFKEYRHVIKEDRHVIKENEHKIKENEHKIKESEHKIKELKHKQLPGDYLNVEPTQPQENINKSTTAIKIESNNASNPNQLESIIGMLKNAGYDTDAFYINIFNDSFVSIPNFMHGETIMLAPAVANRVTDLYFIKINKKYTQSLGTLLHEINHILSGDLEYLKKHLREKLPNKQDLFNFLQSAEYVADIKQIVTNTHLTKENKIEAITEYAKWMEHLLTYKAACQQEGQAATDRIFNNTMAQDYVHIPEERTLPLYDLTLLDEPTHPSLLSRYQLVMRAKQLIEEEQE